MRSSLCAGQRAFLLLVASSLGFASTVEAKKPRLAPITYVRDWTRYPAIVERDTTVEIVALGDVHGGYERLVFLLMKGGLIKADPRSPVKYSWSGSNRVLVCTGDLINKGDQSLPVLDLFMALEVQAPGSGGAVIVTLGNHEAEFLAKPGRRKASEFAGELVARGIDPEDLRTTKSPYGVWMMNRPIAARVNAWFFAHGGSTSGRTIRELSRIFRTALDAGAWDSYELVGERSIIEDQKWWRDLKSVDADLKALGVAHIVFGHDPGATQHTRAGVARGSLSPRYEGKVFPIDVGMSPAINDSRGALLVIDRQGQEDVVTALRAEGTREEIWRGRSASKSDRPTN